jgi:hypothetical protein
MSRTISEEAAQMTLRALVVAAMLWPTVAGSDEMGTFFYTGNSLFEKCSASRDTPYYAACLGYVTGVVDTLNMMQGLNLGTAVCVPNGATVSQIVDVVAQRLRDHPEARHYAAAFQALLALRQSFPCKP